MKLRLVVTVLAGALALLPATAALADSSITASNSSKDSKVETGHAQATNSGNSQVGQEGSGNGAPATASDVNSTDATNVQEGDNSIDATQDATSKSGTAIGGQLLAALIDGNLTVDATNISDHVVARSGDADSINDFNAFVGLIDGDAGIADVNSTNATNVLEGSNSSDLAQTTDSLTGDAVTGQIFVGHASGSVDAVLANTSTHSKSASGESFEDSSSDILNGLFAAGVADI